VVAKAVKGKDARNVLFVERLFGELPPLFKDEDELRPFWGEPAKQQ
jgi:type I restriction enzyme R subunit